MKLSVYKNDFLDALKTVVKFAAVKPMTPILAGVKISADDNTLTLNTVDFQQGVAAQAVLPAHVEVPGEACVVAKYLLEVVSKLDEEVVTFTHDEKTLHIEAGSTKLDVLTFNAQDFPSTEFKTEPALGLTTDLFKEMLVGTLFAVSKDKNDRPVFQGVNFTTTGEDYWLLQAKATDTARISAFPHFGLSYNDVGNLNVVVPVYPLRCVLAEIGNIPTKIDIIPDDNWLIFKLNNLLIKTRLIEGEFPSADKILFFDTKDFLRCNTILFKDALERAKPVAKRTEYNCVVLDIAENSITISTESADCGTFSTVIEAQSTCEQTIAFNVDYLTDFLSTVRTSTVEMRFNGQYEPVQFVGVGNVNEYLYVVTPVRT